MRRVVVTGIGFISPIGNKEEDLVKNLRNGSCGIGEIEAFDPSEIGVYLAGECWDFVPSDFFSKKEQRRLDRVNMLGMASARMALEDSGVDLSDLDPDRVSVQVATGIGGLQTIENESQRAYEKGFDRISPFFIPMVIANMTSAQISIDLGIHGSSACPVTACAASSNAILDAYRSIKDGYYDLVLAGGAEASINRLGLGGFESMKALSKSRDIDRASIPFDMERSGFVMGEGGAILVLEDLEMAIKRGAKIYGEIAGCHMTSDGYHMTAPHPEGLYAGKAMEKALTNSGLSLDQVDYINAHGTSTPMNDKTETLAIKRCFGEHARNIHISSSKSMTGHLLGASGAIEAIITLMAIKHSFIPPTINFRVPDPECDLQITPNHPVDKKIRLALSNSLGFGGHNVSLALKGWEKNV